MGIFIASFANLRQAMLISISEQSSPALLTAYKTYILATPSQHTGGSMTHPFWQAVGSILPSPIGEQ